LIPLVRVITYIIILNIDGQWVCVNSGVGNCSKVGGGLFKLSGHIYMEKITFIWSDSKTGEGSSSPLAPHFPLPMDVSSRVVHAGNQWTMKWVTGTCFQTLYLSMSCQSPCDLIASRNSRNVEAIP